MPRNSFTNEAGPAEESSRYINNGRKPLSEMVPGFSHPVLLVSEYTLVAAYITSLRVLSLHLSDYNWYVIYMVVCNE